MSTVLRAPTAMSTGRSLSIKFTDEFTDTTRLAADFKAPIAMSIESSLPTKPS